MHSPTIPDAPEQTTFPSCNTGAPPGALQIAETRISPASQAALSPPTSNARRFELPAGPAGPASPVSPLAPIGPGGPGGPGSPRIPAGPAGPVSPRSPLGPGGPTGPASPLTP